MPGGLWSVMLVIDSDINTHWKKKTMYLYQVFELYIYRLRSWEILYLVASVGPFVWPQTHKRTDTAKYIISGDR